MANDSVNQVVMVVEHEGNSNGGTPYLGDDSSNQGLMVALDLERHGEGNGAPQGRQCPRTPRHRG